MKKKFFSLVVHNLGPVELTWVLFTMAKGRSTLGLGGHVNIKCFVLVFPTLCLSSYISKSVWLWPGFCPSLSLLLPPLALTIAFIPSFFAYLLPSFSLPSRRDTLLLFYLRNELYCLKADLSARQNRFKAHCCMLLLPIVFFFFFFFQWRSSLGDDSRD